MTRTQVFFGTRAEKQSRITQPSRRRLVFHFGDAILPHAQYGPYYVTVFFFWGGGGGGGGHGDGGQLGWFVFITLRNTKSCGLKRNI